MIARRCPPGPTRASTPARRSAASPARYAVVAPENAEYQESVNALLEQARGRPASRSRINLKYKLDISSMPNQASNIIAQLKDAGVTTVICGCDPVMLALGLTPKANEQGYEPEWITARPGLRRPGHRGAAHRRRGSGRTPSASPTTPSPSRRAARSPTPRTSQMRPNDEPAFGVEEIYYQMYLLAIGIQMAGPNLTPETFEAGMFAYPGGIGPRGAVGLRPGRLHPDRRLPRDLVGPEPHLAAEQQAGRVGPAERRSAVDPLATRRPAPPASSRRDDRGHLDQRR